MSSTENEHLPNTDLKGLPTEATVSPAVLPDQTELSNEYWQVCANFFSFSYTKMLFTE